MFFPNKMVFYSIRNCQGILTVFIYLLRPYVYLSEKFYLLLVKVKMVHFYNS